MVNIYKKRAQEAKSELTKSRLQKVMSWIIWPLAIAFTAIGTVFLVVGNGCQNASTKVNEWSEENKQKAYDKLGSNQNEWSREVKKEKVDSDSISITSSEDGEVVDLSF